MVILLNIVIATFSVGIISFVGILVFYKNSSEKLVEITISLAAGALLGAVFLSILPELFSQSSNGEGLKPLTLSTIILISIIAFFLVERMFHWHHCQCDRPYHPGGKRPMGYINLFGDGFHNFVDGALIASSFLIDPLLGIVTTVVIVLHEIPQEISDFSILLYSGFSKAQALWWNFVSALMAVLGGVLAFYFSQSLDTLIPILLAVASGSFLYLAMSDIMPELHRKQDKKLMVTQFMWLVTGVAIIFVMTLFVPG